jgi:hypothetical protein
MKNLNRYLEQHNAFADIFNRPRLTLETTQARQRVADRLDCDLSPENLTCDGELRGQQLRQKQALLTGAASELAALDPYVTFAYYGQY